MLVAATGLSGFLGTVVARRLSREPDLRIRALVRPGGRIAVLRAAAPAAEIVEGGLADPAALSRLVEGADAVVHAAYDSVGPQSSREFREGGSDVRRALIEQNVLGTAELLAAARRSKVRQFVHVSSFSVYGRQPHEALLVEDLAPVPNNPYSALKAAIEDLVTAFAPSYPDGASLLRPSLVLGVDANPAESPYGEMAGRILRGEPVEAAGGTSTVLAETVAEAILLALRNPAAARGFVNLADRYTDVAEAAEILKKLAGSASDLQVKSRRGSPATPAPCDRARALGVPFRGQDGLQDYLARLLAALRGG